jgi:hypothetical protein
MTTFGSKRSSPCRSRPAYVLASYASSPGITPKSKRSLILPKRAITALKAHKTRQDRERQEVGEAWHANNLVFCQENGTAYTSDALNWRFSKMIRKAGIGHWHAPMRPATPQCRSCPATVSRSKRSATQ